MEIDKLSNEQIEEQIELYLDRIETISDYISDTEDNSVRNVLRNQKERYKQTLNLLYKEKRNQQIKNAMNFDSNIDINLLGTKWIGKFSPDSKKESILVFYPDGVLKYDDISARWEIKEGKIIISINNGFATMYGRNENNKLIGNAVNIQNKEWSFEYKNIDINEILKSFVSENEELEAKINKSIENQILKLGKKWNLKNYLSFESERYNIEICQNGLLKINENIDANWFLKNGRIIFKFNHIQVEYNGEILQNRIYGLAKSSEGNEWIFSGELIPEVVKPANSKTLKIKSENRGFGLMASNNETWNNFKLLDNGFYFEDEEKIILTSVNGQEYKASKGEVPWEAKLYNRSYDEDKNYYDIFYGRSPNVGQFLIYRSKNNQFQNEITIGVLNVKSDGITFQIVNPQIENPNISNFSEHQNEFSSAKIGTQEWASKNLDVYTFRNGDEIPEAKTEEEWVKAGEKKQPVWCYNNNEIRNGAKYGTLYNWDAVNDKRGLAPKGWHVPSDDEWTLLTNYLGEQVAGTKLKSSAGWKDNGNGNNESGFNGLPGGMRLKGGAFGDIEVFGYFWSSTQLDSGRAWHRILLYSFSHVARYDYNKNGGLSVRCLKD